MQNIEWINHSKTPSASLLVSSAREVKLFAVRDQHILKQVTACKSLEKKKSLVIPKPKVMNTSKQGKLLARYKSCKEEKLHSLTMGPDMESFITADESRVDLWSIEKTRDEVYNLVDYERRNPDQHDERVMCAEFNKSSGFTFLYTTSKGKINICDLREKSDFHSRPSVQLQVSEKFGSHQWLSDTASCVSDAKFIPNSYQIASRDYMCVKLWDLRSASNMHPSKSRPIYSAQVTDYMERNVSLLHENESL